MKKVIIATIKPWNIDNAIAFEEMFSSVYEIKIITEKDSLNLNFLNKFKPDIIFFPHWSWIIPEEIYAKFESIVFHMTDLPYGRGGSPLQNLILNKKYETKISALKVEKGFDSGDVYLKKDFYIGIGSAQEIYQKISEIIFFDMIPFILNNKIVPVKQRGKCSFFKRRLPEESNLKKNKIDSLNDLYDFIRMLDAQSYPKAFLKYGKFKIFFENVILRDNKLFGHFEIEKNDLE